MLVTAIARAILGGEPDVEAIVARLSLTFGKSRRWFRPLARKYVATFPPGGTRPRLREVEAFVRAAWRRRREHVAVLGAHPPEMQPASAARAWDVPAIETVGDLAKRLEAGIGELEWIADLKSLTSRRVRQQLRHYRYRFLHKRFGSVRLIEAPKPRLKAIQQRILAEILERIPVHPAAHGFVKGRSIRSFAAPHVAQRVVLRMDLSDFFPSVSGPRVQALFRTAGYPENVADLLGGVCTTVAPRDIWRDVPRNPVYDGPHLPQGAPTSPALANLCAYRVDARLSGLARAAGARYTRYADDLAFSGDDAFARSADRFAVHVAAILAEEGFHVHHRKTRVMRQGVRQYLAGLVANQRINVPRTDFDRLKAILTNCVRHGLASQNRDAHPRFREHLMGRVAYVESVNAERGRKLRALLDTIPWDAGSA